MECDPVWGIGYKHTNLLTSVANLASVTDSRLQMEKQKTKTLIKCSRKTRQTNSKNFKDDFSLG